jgi:lipoprotein-anchoring transpeptidase ErfK/SrfK
MKVTTLVVQNAIRNARAALEAGDHVVARRWAQRAASLAPELEESWLLMAATAAPEASLIYLQQALLIDPGNKQTQADIVRVTELLDAQAKANPQKAHAVSPGSRKPWGGVKAQRTKSVLLKTMAGPSLVFCALLLMVFTTWMTWPEDVSRAQASLSTQVVTDAPAIVPTIVKSEEPTQPTPTPWLPAAQIALPTAAPQPILPTAPATVVPLPSGPKHILVDLSEQRMYAYQGDTLVYQFIVSTGVGGTAAGNFSILDKIPDPYSYPYGFWMPDWLGIYYVGPDLENGIHSLPVLANGQTLWGDKLGTPASYGCVVLGPQDAKTLYDWVEVGTPVKIVP